MNITYYSKNFDNYTICDIIIEKMFTTTKIFQYKFSTKFELEKELPFYFEEV